jgi:hypothetical protein
MAVEVTGHAGDTIGLGGQLAANGRNMGEPAFASSLIETELNRQIGHCQQGELLGGGLLSLTLGHNCIIAKGCDTVVW